jgi:hypothetical protein
MKTKILLFLLLANFACANIPPLSESYINKFADTIYRIEGGKKARKPYGVLSIPVNSEAEARRITINSIRNNWKRWHKAGKPDTFINFFANRWCPASSDPVGNKNWKKNAKFYMEGVSP